jgi:tetratricopeptide (TPR) repeat protein
MCLSPESPLFEESMARLVACSLAIARGEDSPNLFLEYGEALWNVRDLPATIAAMDRAIAGTPRLPELELSRAYASRAICQLQLGNLDAALADVTAALSVDPRGHAAGLRAMIHLYQGRYADAVADAETAVRMDPDDWEVRAWRGMVYLDGGRHAEAIEDFDWVLATGECTRYASKLHLGRARANLALGDPTAAVADCGRAIDEDYHEQSHWPFIVRERVRHAHEAHLVRAEASLQLGQHMRALGDCYFAASIAPDDPAVYDLRARIHHALGHHEEAIRDVVRAEHFRQRVPGPRAEPPGVSSERLVGVSP